jgi:hypothetical protein
MKNIILIWDRHGRVGVQLSGDRVFDSNGREIGWVSGENVYDKNGRHIGWFIGGLLRDSYGKVLGFSSKVEPGQPHPALPGEREGAHALSTQGPSQGKPGFAMAPGRPLLGGKPPLGSSWSQFDPNEYFAKR